MSRLLLYRALGSPPARSVMMLAEIIGTPLDFKDVNILKLEHKSSEFKKLNPVGTVPVLQDGDFILPESHAIMKYLLGKYGSEHSERLYPSELRARSIIDQRMFFNAGVFFSGIRNGLFTAALEEATETTPRVEFEIDSSYEIVDAFLQGRRYVAADHLTLADLSLGSTATALQIFHKVDPEKYPKCSEWLQRLEEDPVFKTVNAPGVAYLSKVVNSIWKRNKKEKEN